EKMEEVKPEAEKAATKKLVSLLVPQAKKKNTSKNPLEMFFSNPDDDDSDENDTPKDDEISNKRRRIEHQLAIGELEDYYVTVDIEEAQPSMFDMLQGSGMEQMGMNMQDALGQFMPKKTKKRKMTVRQARIVLTQQEAQKRIDMD